MNYFTCKKHIESIQNDLLELDFFFDDKILLKKTTEIIINNELNLLYALKHKESNLNHVLEKQIILLEDCLKLI